MHKDSVDLGQFHGSATYLGEAAELLHALISHSRRASARARRILKPFHPCFTKIVPTISDRASLSPSNGLTALPHSCPSWQSSPFTASLPDLARRILRPSCRTDKKPGHGSNKATGAVISLNLGSNFLLAKSIRTHTVNYMRLFTSRIIK